MTTASRAAAPARLARRTLTGLTAALAAALVTCSLMTPAGASAQGTGIPGSLAAVSCPATNACWAVGPGLAQTDTTAVVAQWDGSAWSQDAIPLPSGAQSTSLVSVSCPSTTLCWAAGFAQTAGGNLPYDLQWNGTAWSAVTLPHPPAAMFYPFAVSCSSPADCWAAQDEGGTPPLEHWNGSAWTMVAAPALGPPYEPTLSCVSVSDCWMVGAQPTGRGTYTAHWDGTSWSMVTTPTSHQGSRLLFGVSCRGKACMAVGRDGAAGFGKGPITQRWNGTAWTVEPAGKNPPASGLLNAVSCAAGGKCVTVGGRGGPNPGPYSLLWNGTRWRPLTTPAPSPSGGVALFGVSCITASDCWAVGGHLNDPTPTTSLIEHWNGTAWSIVS